MAESQQNLLQMFQQTRTQTRNLSIKMTGDRYNIRQTIARLRTRHYPPWASLT